MAKVVCKRCESEKIVVVNEMIEQPQKEGTVFFGFLYAIGYIGALLGLMGLSGGEVDSPSRLIGLYVLLGSISFLILVYIFRLLQPFRYKNKTKCICLDCGRTWYLDEENKN